MSSSKVTDYAANAAPAQDDVMYIVDVSSSGDGQITIANLNKGLSGSLTLSTAGPTDDFDVTGVDTLFLDCSSTDVTIGAFKGGVAGQVLHIVRLCAGAYSAVLEHNEGTANQNIFLHAGADEELDTEYGGWNLVCDGTSWFDTSHSKHV